jgi:hypothetical protein
LEGLARSQNNQEGWHNGFSRRCKKHGSTNELVEFLRQEQHKTDLLVKRIVDDDETNVQRSSERKKNEDLLKEVKKYDSYEDKLSYLDKVAKIFDKNKK